MEAVWSRQQAPALIVDAKLRVPRPRAEAIARPRILQLLSSHENRRLVTLSAPAGFGKTSALAAWVAAGSRDAAWLALDRGDRDIGRLTAHLLASVGRIAPAAAGVAARAASVGADPCQTVLPLLANGLAAHVGRPLAIVFDDVHLLDERGAELLARLVSLVPPGVGVVLGSREAAPFPTARLHAAGEAAHLGADALRFDGEETGRFLNGALRLGLSDAELTSLAERTEGWAAGLSLAAISLRRSDDRSGFVASFAGSSRRMADYLHEEVLGALDGPTREFMVRSSILRRLSAPVCAAVLGSDAVARFEQVCRSNLLVIGLDDRGEWFRYHHLLAELLRNQLALRPPAGATALHLRASAWFESAGQMDDAIEHALDGGDGERAARLLCDHWLTLVGARRHATVSRFLERLPRECGRYTPFVEGVAAYQHALIHGVGDDYERYVPPAHHDAAPGVAGLRDTLIMSPLRGNAAAAIARGPAALRRAASAPPAQRYAVAVQYALALWFAGEGAEARRQLAMARPVSGNITIDAWRSTIESGIALDGGEVATAVRCGESAVAIARGSGAEDANVFVPAYQSCAAAFVAAGRLDEAEPLLCHAERVTAMAPDPMYDLFTLIARAQLHVARRDWSEARATAAAARAIADRCVDPGVYGSRLAAVERILDAPSGHVDAGSVPTTAEMRVLELLPSDHSIREIADALFISPNTVRSHTRRLYRRLGVHTRADAVRVARERGLA